MAALVDAHHRTIDYLRVSITDRCNLRCSYCMPHEGVDLLQHSDVLSYEEILRIISVSVHLGISKVRLTGGEPLVRRNVCSLISRIAKIPGVKDLSLTTNGVLLKDMAAALFEAGMRRINVSLDSLNAENYRKITGRDHFQDVWEGIAEAESIGFHPIKINVVMMAGVNDHELDDFAKLAIERPYSIRFIEYMPIGRAAASNGHGFFSESQMRARIEAHGRLVPVTPSRFDGPSRRFRFLSGKGEIGLISGMSRRFCATCNRLRLTSDGKLRPCLWSDREVDVKGPLRDGCSDDDLARLVRQAAAQKPERPATGHAMSQNTQRSMSAIGG